jgi:ferric-dicitrate binding protein FerR (iron transport regulator)
MKKLLFVVLVCMGTSLWAQEAKITEIMGTVEVKAAGSGQWVPASVGQVLSKNASISTGFKSTALLTLGSSTLTVRPLTRLTLEELTQLEGNEQASLYLRTGRVRANVVRPPETSPDDFKFTVRSPSATASVRGTIFDFDGINLKVTDSTVQLARANDSRRFVLVDAGDSSFIDETSGQAVPPSEIAQTELAPELPKGSESGAAPQAEKPMVTQAGSLSVGIAW